MDVENSDNLSPDGEFGTFSVIRLIMSEYQSLTYTQRRCTGDDNIIVCYIIT